MSSSNLERSLAAILDQSQDSTASHAKLVTKCQSLFKETDFDSFFTNFTTLMRNIMTVMQKNPHIDRTIDFIAKFASNPTNNPLQSQANMDATVIEARQTRAGAAVGETTVQIDNTNLSTAASMTSMNSVDSDEYDNVFITSLIDFLIETSKANSDAVRYRSCGILAKLMGAISNEQFIDEDLYDRLSDALLERLKDVNSKVQVQAIAAIYRLQDPNDRDCRISKVFLFLMTYDPNWMVRYQALSHVAFSKMTLPDIIDRVRDPNPSVRKKALIILSEKVLIKFITIEKRLFILNYSLNDEDPGVLETCTKRLLPSWLAFKENDMVKLLKALDVVEATETMELMLDKMNEEQDLEALCNEFVGLLNEKHVIPMEKLSAESVFYWSWTCSQCKKCEKDCDTETNTNINNRSSLNEDYLDRLLPSLTEFCEYTNQVLKHIESQECDERMHIEQLFILKKLVKLFEYIDFSDAHGRKTLTTLCHELFANRSYVFLFDSVMSVYKLLVPNLQQRINNLVELISDLKDPHLKIAEKNADPTSPIAQMDQSAGHGGETCETESSSHDTTYGFSKLCPRELQLKISEAKYKRFQLKDQFDNLYKEVKQVDKVIDLNMLSDLRTQIKQCEDEIILLEKFLKGDIQKENGTVETDKGPVDMTRIDETIINDGETVVNPIECTYHCLNIAICLLKDASLTQITPQLRSLFDNLIIPNIGSVNEEIRINAVKAMSLLCILKLEIAQKYVPLLLEMIQHDMKDVVIEAFHALINCIMAFTMNRLANLDSADTTSNNLNTSAPHQASINDPQQTAERTAKILAVMTSLLDSEDPEIYTTAAEGFCKLYMTGHIVSAKLLTKLIIMYYSPITENDARLRSCLSAFLPQFSFFRPCNQVCVEETFMLIMKALINASADSPLSEIDLTKVMEVMFNLTNPKNLMQRRGTGQRVIQHNNICHENIVRSICYEILKDDNVFKTKTYLKVMQMADLANADYLALKGIWELTDEVQMHIGDKLVKKTAVRFNEVIHGMMVKKPEYEEEQKRKTEEQAQQQLHNELTYNDQQLINGNTNDQTQMNSTRLSTINPPISEPSSSRLSLGNDMIDLDFKGIGKKAPGTKKSNRTTTTLSASKITDETVANETVANETTQMEETVVEARVTRRSSMRLSQAGLVNNLESPVKEPVKITSKILTTKKQPKAAEQRSKSADSNEASEKEEEVQIGSKKARSNVRGKKRSIIEDAQLKSGDEEVQEGDVSRSSRPQTRRSKTDYEPPVKISKDTKKKEDEINKMLGRSTRSTSSKNGTTEQIEKTKPTRHSTRSASSK